MVDDGNMKRNYLHPWILNLEWWVFPLCKSTHIDQLDSENVVVMAQLNLCFIGMTIFSLSNSSMAKEGSNVKKQSTETESNDNV